ncbi:MAG: hypothetical protein V1726_05725 [Methanobacteriota archaeon]
MGKIKYRGHRVSLRQTVFLVGSAFLLACCMMIVTTPLHETGHLVMSSLDPHLQVVSFYPFGVPRSNGIDHVLPSVLGCVIVREAYPGAFNDRPVWADLLQEIVCLSIQMIITCVVTLKILSRLMIPWMQHQHRRSVSYV